MQAAAGDHPVKTFTINFSGSPEFEIATRTAKQLSTDHTEVMVEDQRFFNALSKVAWHFDEPVADPSAVLLYFLAEAARQKVTVVLSGEGADELFGGYNIYQEPLHRLKLPLPLSLRRYLGKQLSRTQSRARGIGLLKRALRPLSSWYIGNASIFTGIEKNALWKGERYDDFSLAAIYDAVRGESDSTKMQYVDMNTWLPGDILAKADKMTMAHSLELRVPFLDIEVANFSRRLSDNLKWSKHETKVLLREASRGLVPEEVRTRKKLGFPTPLRNWLREDRPLVREQILGNALVTELFDRAMIARLIDDHRGGKEDNSRKIHLLLMLAIWYDTFIKV
jgi:asparagine synthase (glutamine-hydrolysing)